MPNRQSSVAVVTTIRVLVNVPADVRLVPVFEQARCGASVQVSWVREPVAPH